MDIIHQNLAQNYQDYWSPDQSAGTKPKNNPLLGDNTQDTMHHFAHNKEIWFFEGNCAELPSCMDDSLPEIWQIERGYIDNKHDYREKEPNYGLRGVGFDPVKICKIVKDLNWQ